MALTNPLLTPDDHVVWSRDVNKVWTSYIEKFLGVKLETSDDKAKAMSEFYENVVKDKPLKLTKAKDGTLIVS